MQRKWQIQQQQYSRRYGLSAREELAHRDKSKEQAVQNPHEMH
jgi:hypothetical protein